VTGGKKNESSRERTSSLNHGTDRRQEKRSVNAPQVGGGELKKLVIRYPGGSSGLGAHYHKAKNKGEKTATGYAQKDRAKVPFKCLQGKGANCLNQNRGTLATGEEGCLLRGGNAGGRTGGIELKKGRWARKGLGNLPPSR